VVLYDTVTGKSEVVADGLASSPIPVTPFAWRAPELGGDIAVMVPNASDNWHTVEIYVRDPDGAWVAAATIASPDPEHPVLWSPQPFVFKDRSYLSVAAFRSVLRGFPNGSSQVWVVSIDPNLSPPIRNKVSVEQDPNIITAKNDPETLAIAGGRKLVVYYIDEGSETIQRDLKVCDSGL